MKPFVAKRAGGAGRAKKEGAASPPASRSTSPSVSSHTETSTDQETPAGSENHIVAVGASAGGLKALQKFVSGLPDDLGAPVLIVPHMDPDHPSGMAALLQRHTKLKVKQAEEGEPVVAGCIYIARPDHHLEVRKAQIHLSRSARLHFSRPSIDRLFTSVSRAYGATAVAVVLSGSGADGSAGVIDVKGRGGAVVVEHESTAEFAAMPTAAGRTGCADAVLPIGEIAGFVTRALSADRISVPDDDWDKLIGLVRDACGTDFAAYRSTTLRRRLQRRLAATGDKDLGEYLRRVEQDDDELAKLHAAFLIKVSSFMRDPDAWAELRSAVIEPLVKAAKPDQEIRAWSAGCATGEEAYSLAIALSEATAGRPDISIRVFATDIAEDALTTARSGFYLAGQLENLDPQLLRRYFAEEGDGWRVTKGLRNRVIFGKHDLLQDPPFSSIDVLTCRNVLIYFSGRQKHAALQRFAYALRPGGHLMLGRSEGARTKILGCTRLPGPSNLYRREDIRYVLPGGKPRTVPPSPSFKAAVDQARGDQQDNTAFQHLMVESTSVLMFTVDSERRIQMWNRAAQAFFGVRSNAAMGHPLYEVVEVAPSERLSKAVKEALARNCPIHLSGVPCEAGGGRERMLDLDVIPFDGGSSGHALLFVGVDVTSRHQAEGEAHELLAKAQVSARAAADANEALTASNEELETLNEELQSISEEQQSTNEEMESRNEELETVNEELQSTNEELTTLNDEVRQMVEDSERATAFLSSVLDALPGAIIGCDRDGVVVMWSEAATRRFLLSPAQVIGHRLYAQVPVLDTPELAAAVSRAVAGSPATTVTIDQGPQGLSVEVRGAADSAGHVHGYFLMVQAQ